MKIRVMLGMALGILLVGGAAQARESDPPIPISEFPAVPTRAPDVDVIINQCGEDKFVYKHIFMQEKLIVFGIVHQDLRHEAPVVIVVYRQDNQFHEAYVKGERFDDFKGLIARYPTSCAWSE